MVLFNIVPNVLHSEISPTFEFALSWKFDILELTWLKVMLKCKARCASSGNSWELSPLSNSMNQSVPKTAHPPLEILNISESLY